MVLASKGRVYVDDLVRFPIKNLALNKKRSRGLKEDCVGMEG